VLSWRPIGRAAGGAASVDLPDRGSGLAQRHETEEEIRFGRRLIVLAWLASRALVLVSAVLAQVLGFERASWHTGFGSHPFEVLATWDGKWYRTIAEHGYLQVGTTQSDPAFFPLLPIVLRGLHAVGFSYDIAGMAVDATCFLIALLALYELGREWLPEADARRATLYAAVFPMSFVFSMVYPEGPALAAMALAGLLAVRRRWLAAAVCGSLAAFARPEGVLVVLPLAAAAVRSWPSLSQAARARASAAVLAPLATIAAISLYFWSVLGDPFAWSSAQHAWGRSLSPTAPYHALAEVVTAATHDKSWLFRDAAFVLLYLLCLAVAWRRGLPRGWIAAGLAMVLMPLASGSFQSEARFGLLAVAAYWGLALLGRRIWLNRAILALSPLLLVAGVFTLYLRWP
jgi:hypothetical protein